MDWRIWCEWIQLSTVITWCDVARYCIDQGRQWWGQNINQRLDPQKTQRAMVYLLGEPWTKLNWPRYNGAALYLGEAFPLGASQLDKERLFSSWNPAIMYPWRFHTTQTKIFSQPSGPKAENSTFLACHWPVVVTCQLSRGYLISQVIN